MNENMTIVVEALRSGDYKQTSGRLRRGDEFCCLGVMCEKYHEITGEGGWTPGGPNGLDVFAAGDLDASVNYASGSDLPDAVRDWVGLKGWAGTYDTFTDGASLMERNDTGCTFAEIADIIESEPEGLFA